MSKRYKRIETKAIHAGAWEPRIEGAVVTPIFQSSTYEYTGETDYSNLKYIRLNNTPNHVVLHRKLAALEGGEDALVTSSGMAAISTTLLALLASGDHLLVQQGVYGGTHRLITSDFPDFGIGADFIDPQDPDDWARKLTPTTRAIYVETISNPLMDVANLESIVDFARSHGLISVIDNTFTSPVNFRPPEAGFDVSLHSATKYLNGHSDIVAGAVIGRGDLVDRIRGRLKNLGGTLDPHACFLLERGLKTLPVRVRYQNESALQIARYLSTHPRVERVYYPGLEDHPQHERARRLFEGCGGMLSFELREGMDAVGRFFQQVEIPMVGPSLGGVESLMTRPSASSHHSMPPEERRRLGISDSLIRFSVGLEATTDLIEDLERSL